MQLSFITLHKSHVLSGCRFHLPTAPMTASCSPCARTILVFGRLHHPMTNSGSSASVLFAWQPLHQVRLPLLSVTSLLGGQLACEQTACAHVCSLSHHHPAALHACWLVPPHLLCPHPEDTTDPGSFVSCLIHRCLTKFRLLLIVCSHLYRQS